MDNKNFDVFDMEQKSAIEDEIYGTDKPRTALEFEVVLDGSEFEFDTEAEETEDGKQDDEPIKEEFTIPDALNVDPKYSTVSFIEDPKRMRTTYVPRFTEVSENYRMKEGQKKYSDLNKVKTVSSDIDATSEIDEEKEVQKVIVMSNQGSIEEPKDESITLFKFDNTDDFVQQEEQPVLIQAEIEESQDEAKEDLSDLTEENKATDSSSELRDTYSDTFVHTATLSNSINYSSLHPEEAPKGSFEGQEKLKGGVNSEYFSPIQKDAIKDKFLDTILATRLRLISSAFVFLIMIAVELLNFADINVYSYIGMGSSFTVRAAIDFVFATSLALIALPEIINSIFMLFKKKCTPELFIIFSYAVLGAYTAITIKIGISDYPTFGMLFALMVLCAIISAYVKAKSEYSAFKVVSKNGIKNVLDKRLTRTLPRENMALDGAIDEYKSKTARVFRTSFVCDFFGRTKIVCENTVNIILMLSVGAGLSAVTAIVCYFLGGNSLSYATNAFCVVFMMSCPAFSILLHKVAFGYALREANADNGTFVGEESIYSTADVDVVTYEDTEIFGTEDVSIKKVYMYGKVYNMPKAMQQMYSLFSVVGGPLNCVFANSLDRKGDSCDNVIIEDDGISGMLGSDRISAGTEEYMQRHGIKIPTDDVKSGMSNTETTRVMYGAENGEVYVKFYIRYSFSEEFSMLLPHLKAEKIVPLIYTRDPNITPELLKLLTMGDDLIRVMKKKEQKSTEEKTYRRISSGTVTDSDKSSAVNMVLLAKKYSAFQSLFGTGELVAMMVGAVLAIVFSISGVFVMPTFALAVLQLALCVFFVIRAKLTFRTGRKK